MTTKPGPSGGAAKGPATKSIVRHLPTAGQVLMGLIFFVTGLNGFLNFLPQPSTLPASAVAFAEAMTKTGYLVPLVMGTQLIVAVLLLLNLFVPLALAIIAPIIVNIIAFHVFLEPSGIGSGIVVLVLELYLVWMYRRAYRPMLAMRTTPGSGWQK